MSFCDDTIKIDGYVVNPAKVLGSADVFSVSNFIFEKPRWINDNEAGSCAGCSNSFTQIRRRHHCRQCGQIFCSKCCSDKLFLSHMSMETAERVCEGCKPISELLIKAQLNSLKQKQEAAAALAQMITNPMKLMKVVELGGVQTLIYLCNTNHCYINSNVASALHIIAQHQSMFPFLVASGSVKALTSVLAQSNETDDETTRNAIGTLHLFAKSEEMLSRLLDENAVPELIRVCENVSPTSLLAVQILSLLVRSPSSRFAALNRYPQLISKIVSLANCNDQQMQITCLRILCLVSEDREEYRDYIIKEDFKYYKPILNAIRRPDSILEILSNTLFLTANLATTKHHQKLISDHIDAVCDVMERKTEVDEEIMTSIIRALANSAEHADNRHILMDRFQKIVEVYLHSPVTFHRLHVLRLIFNLMYDDATAIINVLNSLNETKTVLEQLSGIPGLVDSINKVLLNNASPIVAFRE